MLCVDPSDIELARIFEGLLDSGLRDLVEDDALVTAFVTANHLSEMPGNRLALAIEIRREVDGISIFRELSQVAHDLFLAG